MNDGQALSAAHVAIRAAFMVDSAVSEGHGPGFAIGKHQQVSWQLSEPLTDFMNRCFPAYGYIERSAEAFAEQKSIKAWKLKSRLGISFRGTDNLAQHLLLDERNAVLYLFHHSSFLKAQLVRLLKEGVDKEADMSACLPRFVTNDESTETLHSLQSILFHWNDRRSTAILDQLIESKGFDEDCAEAEGYFTLDDSIDQHGYVYWGERLATLHGLMKDRPPRNAFERWIKWQTSESNALLVAVLALVISIFVGILSLGLAALQTWIAWKAWKEPVAK
ncbi:hypothetical protein CDD83_2494 [Cordyceps sp. RAO-2017]|nr:hypothetical protein CDD83_2494 [Cordyceps sp. RAO-2017]